jgi:hypothetical protein
MTSETIPDLLAYIPNKGVVEVFVGDKLPAGTRFIGGAYFIAQQQDIIRSLEAKVEEYKKREAVICKFMNGLGIEKINIPEGWFDGFGGCANENK